MVKRNTLLKDLLIKSHIKGIVAEFIRNESDNSSTQEESPPSKKKRKMEQSANASESSPASSPSVSSLHSNSRENNVEGIRIRLGDNLVGSSFQIRHQLVQRFLSEVTDSTGWSSDTILSFLDSILDETFSKLDFIAKEEEDYHPLALVDPVKLLKVFARRSPLINKLKLCFGLPRRSVPFKLSIIGQMLAAFKNLTSLSLDWKTTDRSCLLFFTALGDSCPKLITLKLLGDLPFGIQQVLALMLGKKRELLPQDFLEEIGGEESLAEVQFAPESLTPICHSLKKIEHINSGDCLNTAFCSIAASVAFILRHFRQLQTWEDSKQDAKILGAVVQLLHQQQQRWAVGIKSSKQQSRMSIQLGLIQWAVNVPFSGVLNLVTVQVINICSRKMMHAITALCPNLKRVQITGRLRHLPLEDVLSIKELQFLLSSSMTSFWYKVESVTMFSVFASYRQTLLSHIGGRLRGLKLFYCSNIDPIVELLPCTLLESLDFKASMLKHRPRPCLIDDANVQFLPSLERLTTLSTCLGDWSSLFECSRPLLTELSLFCSHIGVASKSPLFDWHNIPKMWPNLRALIISNASKLTLDKLKGILNLLNKLEGLFLFPSTILQQSVDEIGIVETRKKVASLLDIKHAEGDISSRKVVFRVNPCIGLCPFIANGNV